MNSLTYALFLVAIMGMAGCTARYQPAPVETLSTRIASVNNLTEISGDIYTVQSGDTLFAIAFYSGNTYRDLAKINGIKPPYSIKVGQVLQLSATPPKNKLVNVIKSPQVAQNTTKSVQKSTKVVVDRPAAQAYGGKSSEISRQNQNVSRQTTLATKENRWIWPASGEHKVATVGADGSHRGLDIKGRLGSSIVAAAGGKVVYAGNALKGYGNLIIIKHDDEYLSAYAHNDRILVGEQTYVEQGQQIATMGQSGASEVMLHFEIRKKGKSRDPFLYLSKQ
jgi:lipoprotein NlpD